MRAAAPPSPSVLPTWRQTLIVVFITLQLSWLLKLLFAVDFMKVYARIAPIGLVFLLLYASAPRWQPRWLSLSVTRLLAICVAAPLVSLLSFWASEGAQLPAYLSKAQGLGAVVVLSVVALLAGLPTAAVALHLERKARERDERLRIERQQAALERDLLDARLRLLQAQIEPHFLFNTLANVLALVESGSPNAAAVLRHLIHYLRAAMPHLVDADATLGKEMELVEAYLGLMRMRMPDRLQYALELPAPMARMRFPAMLVLTLVENAVRHGIDPAVRGGLITVGGSLAADAGQACVWVEDSGVGMAEHACPGAGLGNVRTRLRACFGDSARLALHAVQPHGVRAELHFHLERSACTASV